MDFKAVVGLKRLAVFIAVGLLLATAGSLSSGAQSQKDSGVDIHYHIFQPPAAQDVTNGASVTPAQADKLVLQQITLLQQDKAMRTAAQRKIDSNIIYTVRMLSGQAAAPGISSLDTGVTLDDNNNVVIDIVGNVSEALVQRLKTAGAVILYQNADLRSIRAVIPPNQIEGIAASPDVTFIWPKQESSTHRVERPASVVSRSGNRASNFEERAARVRRALAPLAQGPAKIITGQGSAETEGDITHRAFDARGVFGVTGAGLKIGVLSDGVSNRALSQATGDLPADCPGGGGPCLTVLAGQAGSGDEGTAMLEIIHDMVPGANLYFATANNSITSFAANIRALQTAGCNIIVDDVFYFVETPFQDGQTAAVVSTSNGGVVTQAVNDVVAAGAFYFSSSGNEGNLDSGTSGTFEGDFVAQAAAAPLPVGNVHNFGAGNGFDTITAPGGQVVGLFWTDPLGGSSNDYDLFVLNSTGTTILAASTNVQSGTQDPVELLGSASVVNNNRIVVFQNTGAANRFFHLGLFRGGLSVATAGETHGHSAASGAYTVAATPAATGLGAPNPNGPFPNAFSAANQIELFSSDGPRHIFFNADSTAITAGNFSSTGGSTLSKPDITAADGVSVTGVGGFGSPFFGTSAAAPSAASVAALALSAKPTLTAAQMRTALTSTAIDIMGPGFDRDAGNGIVMAFQAIQSLGVAGQANPEIASVVTTQNPGNGDGILKAGEGGQLVIQLQNTSGVLNATGITATLATSTAGVTVTLPGTSAYADIAAGATGGTNLTPFTFTLASNFGCASTINFTLTVNTTGGGAAHVLAFSVPVNAISITNTLGTTPPTTTGVTTTTGLQTGRINRNGVISVCGTAKVYPGTIAGSHTFDAYTFTAQATGCAPFGLNSAAAGINLFESVYTSPYDPANIGTNYAADAGLSGALQTCGLTLTAGTSYTIVVNEIGGNPPPPAPANTYTIQIPACALQATINQLPIAIAQNVTVTATTFNGTAAANINNGSSDPEAGPITITQTPPGPYPVGVTTVILTVVDNKGATAQASATVTVVNPGPDVTISKTHVGNFVQGQVGAQYTITVSDLASAAPTAGTVTVVDTLPAGMTATAITGTGWTCTLGTLTCTRADVLASGASYPTITVTVNVAINAGASLTNTAVVSGGGETNAANDTATSPTTVSAADFSLSGAPLTLAILAGQTATFTITVTPTVGGFPNAVALTQSGSPSVGASATFLPTSVTPSSSAQTSQLTITTTPKFAGSPFPVMRFMPHGVRPMLLWAMSLMILLATFFMFRRRGYRWTTSRAGIAAMFVLCVVGITGCGSATVNANQTPSGNYTITVTGTSNGVARTTVVILTVN